MKRYLIIVAACILAIGCHHTGNNTDTDDTTPKDPKTFSVKNLKYETNYLVYSDEEFPFAGNIIGLRKSFDILWPNEGCLTTEAEHELAQRYFCNGNDDLKAAARTWLNDISLYLEDGKVVISVKEIDDSIWSSYFEIESTCRQQDDIATIAINRESYLATAVHGLYSYETINIDLNTGNIIHLNDLVNTNLLGPVIVRAVEDLPINSDVQKALYYDNPDRLPVPPDFTIDSTRSTITLIYQVYEIASYADGIQEIVLPIFWLSKHIPLTPYAKQLFGPESSL